jgi:hypothetical protein
VSQINVTLAEQNADLRSRRVSYLLTVANRSDETLRIEDLVPKVRAGLSVVSTEQLSPQREEIERHAEILRADLQRLAVDHLVARLHTHPAGPVSRVLHWLDGRTGPPYLAENRSGSARGLAPQLDPVILGHADARRIAEHYFPASPAGAAEPDARAALVRETFLLKLEQLRDAEHRREALQADRPIAHIPAHASHSVLFVLEFRRGAWNSRSYSVSIDVHYRYVGDDALTFTHSAETLQVISPYPTVMTLVAMLGGLLGVVLRAAEAVVETAMRRGHAPDWEALLAEVGTPPGLVVAPLLALIFFNIFEFTTFSERLKMSLNWRTALFIGVLCGLATERILHALTGFLGP